MHIHQCNLSMLQPLWTYSKLQKQNCPAGLSCSLWPYFDVLGDCFSPTRSGWYAGINRTEMWLILENKKQPRVSNFRLLPTKVPWFCNITHIEISPQHPTQLEYKLLTNYWPLANLKAKIPKYKVNGVHCVLSLATGAGPFCWYYPQAECFSKCRC